VYALDAAAKRRLKLAGVKVPLAAPPGRNPTPSELKQVLLQLSDYSVEMSEPPPHTLSRSPQWQARIWHRERPAVKPWVFIEIDGVRGLDIPQPFRFVRGTPELMLQIVESLCKLVGPLVLQPEVSVPPYVVQPDLNLGNSEFLGVWRSHEPPPVKRLSLPAALRPGEVDLNLGMVEAVLAPPKGYVSKHRFQDWNLEERLATVRWFAKWGEACSVDLSVGIQQVSVWNKALESCSASQWRDVQTSGQNQLTLFLHRNDNDNYQNWGRFTVDRKQVLDLLIEEPVRLFKQKHAYPDALLHSVQWDILGALMEEIYKDSDHHSYFFHELVMVYEAGHFPCGWIGDWPNGTLLIY
jgi:hypothetical protein